MGLVRITLLRFCTDRFRCAACELRRSQIREVRDEATRTWRVDEEALRTVENDLQAIVNCTQEGDIILLDVDGSLQFTARVTLPWQLTLSGNVGDPSPREGVFPAARRKQRIVCPRDDEGVFLVR